MSRTMSLSKAAEQIAAIIRQRSADAIVDVEIDYSTPEVSSTWRRGNVSEVRLRVMFRRIDSDGIFEANVITHWGGMDTIPSGAVTFARLVTDVAAIACEIEALTSGCVFTTGKA